MRRQHAARGEQAHRGERDLLVAAAGVGHVRVRLGERRRVEHDHVVLLPHLHLRAQEVKAVGADGVDLRAVERRVAADELHRAFADVHRRHLARAAHGRVERKAADVGEAVEHPCVPAELPQEQVVVLLIQEVAGLLAAAHVHGELHTVLADDRLPGQLAVQDLCEAGHALLDADGVVVIKQQARRLLAGDQRVRNHLRVALHAQRQHLQHDHAAEAVRNHAGQTVRLAVDQAAGIGALALHDEPAVVAGRLHAGGDQLVGDLLLPVGQQAHGNQAAAVVEARAHVPAAEIDDRHQIAVDDFALDTLNLVAVHPGMALEQLLLPSVDDVDDGQILFCHNHSPIHSPAAETSAALRRGFHQGETGHLAFPPGEGGSPKARRMRSYSTSITLIITTGRRFVFS